MSPISIWFAAISDKGSPYTSPYILLEYEVGGETNRRVDGKLEGSSRGKDLSMRYAE